MNKQKKILVLIIALNTTPFLRGGDIVLPAKLSAYENSIVTRLDREILAEESEATIHVTVAAGETDVVERQEEMEVPRGSTAAEIAALWTTKHGKPLLGWAQGLVVVLRKAGNKTERITWTMRLARTEAAKFELQNGDVLIGLVFGDY